MILTVDLRQNKPTAAREKQSKKDETLTEIKTKLNTRNNNETRIIRIKQ